MKIPEPSDYARGELFDVGIELQSYVIETATLNTNAVFRPFELRL